MGKRRRGRSRAAISWPAVVALCALGVIALTASAVAIANRPKVDEQAIAEATERINQAAEDRALAEAGERESAIEANRTRLARPVDRDLNVLYLGDSLAAGYYASSKDLAWPALVSQGIDASVSTTIEATPGQTVTDALRKPIPSDQDLVFVELGTNDAQRSTPEVFEQDFPAYLAAVQEASPSARIVCLTPFLNAQRSAATARIIEQSCRAIGAPVRVLSSVYAAPGARSVVGQPYWNGIIPDDGHPSDKGHQAIADMILAWIILE